MEVTPRGGREDGGGMVGRRVGRYIVESKIGGGGMGEVYLARDTRLPRHVALKRMSAELRDDPGYRRRFQEEADKAIRISDHRIASVLDVIEEHEETFLVLEYVPGPTLRQRLQGPIDVTAFLPLALECTEALAAAHRSGIVHRDIKPENYVLGPRGSVKLLDLGVAKVVPLSESDNTVPLQRNVTQGTSVTGTPAYMAPEALRGVCNDFRSDIFSLGVMFYEMLSGEHPFRATTLPAMQDRILHDDPVPVATLVPAIPRGLDRLVARMIAKDPARRPSSAHSVLHDLIEIGQHDLEQPEETTVPLVSPATTGTASAGDSAPLRGWLRRHHRPVIVAIGVLAATWLVVHQLWPPAAPLPEDLRVHLVRFSAPDDDTDSNLLAAGVTRMLEQTFHRLTDAHALDALPRPGRHFRPLAFVTLDAGRSRALELSGTLASRGDVVEVRLALRNEADSSLLRTARITAPASDPLTLVHSTAVSVAQMLGIDVTAEELAREMRTSTRSNAAFGHDLRGLGYLFEAEDLEDAAGSTASKLRLSSEREAVRDPAQLRLALLDSATTSYVRAAARDSTDAEAWFGQAMAGWTRCNGSQASDSAIPTEIGALCQRVLRLDLDHAACHALLGEYYAAQHRESAAIGELERAVELDPTDHGSAVHLAKLYSREDRADEVEKLYRHQIRHFPDSYYWYAYLGSFFFRRAAYDSAALYYHSALAREPYHENALAGMGATCLMQGRYESAIPYLRAAIDLRPTGLKYSNLATAYFVTRRLAAAESAYMKATEIDPENYLLWGNLGDSRYFNPERRGRAEEAYRKAIALGIEVVEQNPNDHLLRARQALYHTRIGELPAGLTELGWAKAGHVTSHDALFDIALVYDQLGNSDSTFVYLQRALDAGYPMLWVQDTPELDGLRLDPRFSALRVPSPAVH